VFFVILEEIVQIATFVRRCAQVKNAARVRRGGSRWFRFAGDWSGSWFRSCFDEWAAAHPAEAVVARVFISTIGAAQVFLKIGERFRNRPANRLPLHHF
jgi:hypothetical protein